MTYLENKDLKISTVVASEMKALVKKCLSIVDTSTYKDDEILLLINAAVLDIERMGINVEENSNDSLIQSAVVMWVKANFGMCEESEKKLAMERYKMICGNLSLSSKYKVVG